MDFTLGVCWIYDFRNFEAYPSQITVNEPKKKSFCVLWVRDSTPRISVVAVDFISEVASVSKTVMLGWDIAAARRRETKRPWWKSLLGARGASVPAVLEAL